VEYGERIAFIGPNGAGKSTTIKMLTGILYPTSGKISVLGLNPQEDRNKLSYQIGTVFGQRSQLLPNLPFTDTMELFGVMYDLSNKETQKRISELISIFDLGSFKNTPVRKLSLGQRMKAEIATSLLHKPKIILLDEPTIGLDIVAKKTLREQLLKINKELNTTIFLTSHDVGDIESLCERTIIINNGTIIKDSPTLELSKTFIQEKYIDVELVNSIDIFPDLPFGLKYKSKEKTKITVIVDLKVINIEKGIKLLLDIFEVEDLNVYNIELEQVIRHIYEKS
jgi:ABC-2 type transport system ATP-binding protein